MGEPIAPQAVIQIVLQFVPSTGQFGVQWSETDEVTKLGMLEMAKTVVLAERVKAMEKSNIIAARGPIPKGPFKA